MVIPTQAVVCGCEDHKEAVPIDKIFNITAKQLFETLFGSTSKPFWDSMDKDSNTTNRIEEPWGSEPNPTRQTKFVVPMNNSFVKLKQIDVFTTSTLKKREEFL
jgi:hypothetical protein